MHPVSASQFVAFFFNAAGRITRREYVLGILFVYSAAFTVIFFIATRMEDQPEISLGLLINLPLVVSLLVLMAKRCHDLGLPGSFVLLVIVPVVGVVWLVALAFIPGKPGPNAYGPAPTHG